MATGTTLANLRQMLKGELSSELSESIAQSGDDVLNMQLANHQKWLALHYDFSDLMIRREINMVAGTRYYDFPTTGSEQDFELNRRILVECYWSNLWYSTEMGIKLVNYNTLNPDLGMKLDPVIRWQKYKPSSGAVQIEVWPLPASATKLRLTGMARIPALTSDSHTCVLDDLLIVQWTAAKMLARLESSDAPAMLAEAQLTLSRLIGQDNSGSQVFSMSGKALSRRDPAQIPTVAVNYTP